MMRRLMLELIGSEELNTMTALGHGRKGKPGKAIPAVIRNAVYSKYTFKIERLNLKLSNICEFNYSLY